MSYFKTRMTEILGIEYPIMCGGLQNAANPELAVAISEAGGLGITNISMYPNLDDFRTTMKWMRAHTSKPLAVNISMIPNIDMGDKIRQYLTICGEEGICSGCGVATLSISYYDLGKTTGQMAAKILTGEADISAMPIEYTTATPKYNPAICEALGITPLSGYTAIED